MDVLGYVYGRLRKELGERKYTKLFAPLVAARAPLPWSLWMRCFGIKTTKINKHAAKSQIVIGASDTVNKLCCKLLVVEGDGDALTVRFAHRSSVRWLTGTKNTDDKSNNNTNNNNSNKATFGSSSSLADVAESDSPAARHRPSTKEGSMIQFGSLTALNSGKEALHVSVFSSGHTALVKYLAKLVTHATTRDGVYKPNPNVVFALQHLLLELDVLDNPICAPFARYAHPLNS